MTAHAVLVAIAAIVPTAGLANDPHAAIHGRFKEGMYEMKTMVDMSAMADVPKQFAKQENVHRACMTATSLTEPNGARFSTKNMKKSCQFENLRVSGDMISYRTTCKAPMVMTSDTVMTFTTNGYVLENKGLMQTSGTPKPFSQRTDARYLGPCPPVAASPAPAAREQSTEDFLKDVLGKDLSPEALKVIRDMEAREKAQGPKGK